jgi:hypothetical protein
MDIYQVEEFFKNLNEGKAVKMSFPVECHRKYEIMMTEGKPNPTHHLECHHVLVEIEGQKPVKVPISPHRMTLEHSWFQKNVGDVLKQ